MEGAGKGEEDQADAGARQALLESGYLQLEPDRSICSYLWSGKVAPGGPFALGAYALIMGGKARRRS